MRLPSEILIFEAERQRMLEMNERRRRWWRRRRLPPEVVAVLLIILIGLSVYALGASRRAAAVAFMAHAPVCADGTPPCRGRL